MSRSGRAFVVAVLLGTWLSALQTGAAEGREPKDAPPPASEGPVELLNPKTPQPAGTPRTGSARVPRSAARTAADVGALREVRRIAMAEGTARLLVNGRETTVRPGDLLGTDVVSEIGPDRIVLWRPAHVAPASGEGTVVMSFDPSGRARVRVYSTRDASAVPPPGK